MVISFEDLLHGSLISMINLFVASIILVTALAEDTLLDIDIREAPYHVTLEYGKYPMADGALLAPGWVVVTGGSITWYTDDDWANYIQIRAGSNKRSEGGIILKPKNHTWHPLFDEHTFDYDVALIQLDGVFTIGDNIALAVFGVNPPTAGTQVNVTGFGSNAVQPSSPDYLQRFNVPIIARTACRTAYQDYVDDITDRIICAGMPTDLKVCYGEGGATVTHNGALVALYAFSFGCIKENTPALLTNLLNPEIQYFIHQTIT